MVPSSFIVTVILQGAKTGRYYIMLYQANLPSEADLSDVVVERDERREGELMENSEFVDALPGSRQPRPLTQENVRDLMKSLAGDPVLKLIVLLALKCGLRRKEIEQILWEDVCFSASTLSVGRNTMRGPRLVPFDAEVSNALAVCHGSQPKDSCYVLGSNPGAMMRKFEMRMRQVGHKMSFYRLRHTWIARMMNAGVSPAVLCAIAGWSSRSGLRLLGWHAHAHLVSAYKEAIEASRKEN